MALVRCRCDIALCCAYNTTNMCFQGKDALVLVYGAPGTGKTYALEGGSPAAGHTAGIVPKAADAIFGHLSPVPREKYLLQATLSGSVRPHRSAKSCIRQQGAAMWIRGIAIHPDLFPHHIGATLYLQMLLNSATSYVISCPAVHLLPTARLCRAHKQARCMCCGPTGPTCNLHYPPRVQQRSCIVSSDRHASRFHG